MIVLVLSFLLTCVAATPNYPAVYPGLSVLGSSYHYDPIVAKAVPVAPTVAVAEHTKGDISYTLTDVKSPTGALKQQTAVGKDALGGHTIRHSAQATNVDPHSGQTDVQHDEHEFHINPYLGAAAVHTNNAEGSLNPSIGQAAFAQKTHEAKIAPGHASVADVKETAEVSAFSSAASRDVNAARTDAVHDGIAKNAHTSHKSYLNAPGIGGSSKVAEVNHQSFDGPGYGNLHYDSQSADEAYDAHGRAAANEQGYKLDQAYDARVNLGASNELQYSRHAAHDPYGNYGAVTQTKQSTHGGQLVPIVQEQPAVVIPQPVVYSEPEPVYQKQTSYYEPAPIAYQKKSALVYNEPVPVIYPKQRALVYDEPLPVSYQKHSTLYYEPRAIYKQPVVYGKSHYSGDGYYRHGY
ncbi:uncharacterized protein [Parasteatoda tepidariorum]|uniref:uncharacterized protein n=1 Tax=Parasteatoda tepidariorum TaxID=114398 RepID=UPI00077FC3BB|nr:uncharacterized protein LOC107440163 [Parasteatoda tepidariorum]